MDKYEEFLRRKEIIVPAAGIDVANICINRNLFDFQRDIVLWALRKGKAAIFAGTGLGKTLMQLEWAKHIGGTVLILAPLAVSKQTIFEGGKFGISVNHCQSQEDVVKGGINITNYERMERFDFSKFRGIVLDESSILKAQAGKIRTQLIECCRQIPYRLACTATPAPNDLMELCNHSEFLGVMSSSEMLATFFVHDGGDTSKWRLKRHAVRDFWQWVASWSVMLTNPSDIGYDGARYNLPPLNILQHTVHTERPPESLFAVEALTLKERQQARRDSVQDRAQKCAEIVNNDTNQWLIWCNLNSEAEALKKLIPEPSRSAEVTRRKSRSVRRWILPQGIFESSSASRSFSAWDSIFSVVTRWRSLDFRIALSNTINQCVVVGDSGRKIPSKFGLSQRTRKEQSSRTSREKSGSFMRCCAA